MKAKDIREGDVFVYKGDIFRADADVHPTPESVELRLFPCFQGSLVVEVSQFREDGSYVGCNIPLSFPRESTEVEPYTGPVRIQTKREQKIQMLPSPRWKNWFGSPGYEIEVEI